VKLAFVVADPRAQAPSFSTTYLARAAMRRGHDVGYVGVDDLTLGPDNHVTAVVRRPEGVPESNQALCDSLAAAEERDELLGGWDVVFLRFNPHREVGPLGAPVIDFGWRLRLGGVTVVNDPEGAQRAGGRMYLSGLPAEIRPRTLISSEPAQVKRFLKALDAPALIKPLAERYAAASRFYVHRGQVKNLNQMIAAVKKSGYLVVQEYLADAVQGEKRLLLLGGEPIRSEGRVAIYRRAADDLPTDDGAPTGRRPCELGPAEQRIVDLLRPKLEADGLYFVGVDIVGDKVLEVNVFTPGGAHACANLYGLDVGEVVIRDLEGRLDVRRAYRRSLDS
jgi:glutathione synthase